MIHLQLKINNMKKIVLLFVAVLLATSCKDKKEVVEETKAAEINYSLVIDAVYEKDDSIVAFYKLDNYFKYDKPVTLKIKGGALSQRIKLDFPEGVAIEDINLTASTNKEQAYITVKNMSVLNNETVVVDGNNYKHSDYFLSDQSFSWDPKFSRYNLNHGNQYPPGFVGNEKLKSALSK